MRHEIETLGTSSMNINIHLDYKNLVSFVRNLYHEPYEGMGYRSVKRRWGTYWNNNEIYTERFPPDQVNEFLADIGRYYDSSPVYINVDGREEDATLGSALCEAGCKKASPILTNVKCIRFYG